MKPNIPNITQLKEHMALTQLECHGCGKDIELGDACFIDDTDGIEFHHVKFYCTRCIDY